MGELAGIRIGIKMINGVDDMLAESGPESVFELFAEAEDPDARERLNQAQILIQLASRANLFHTPEDDAYAQIPVRNHLENWALRTKGFRRWLIKQFYDAFGKPPGAQAMQEALGLLEARAQIDGPEFELFIRVAGHAGRIYVDLVNADWQVVEIDTKGWRVISDPPVRFRRSKGMQSLSRPAIGGSVQSLRKFVNVGNDINWVLCASWLLAALRPTGPYPVLILQGEQGSAKSTMEKLLRKLVDPSVAPIRSIPREDRDLLITASNSWILAYDNLSGIPPWLSDSLCRLATGGGFSTRELYTDSDEAFFNASRPVVLNGIDHLAERADLADRALILNLPRIESCDRRDETQIYAEFERELPNITGGLFSAVSASLARLPHVHLLEKPRMADFAIWATAGEEALGFRQGDFIAAYSGNRSEAVLETLEADPVGSTLILLMDKLASERGTGRWDGTCADLQKELDDLAAEDVRKSKHWPKTPRGLSGRLRRLATFLREAGIKVDFPPKTTNGQRPVTIVRTTPHRTATNAATATSGSVLSADQPVRAEQESGGVSAVAVEPHVDNPSPLPDSPATSMKNHDVPGPIGDSGGGGDGWQNRSNGDNHRINLCRQCGPVDWQWVDGAWTCPKCGAPAGVRKPDVPPDEIDRFEL
jgi:hypothetical protein